MGRGTLALRRVRRWAAWPESTTAVQAGAVGAVVGMGIGIAWNSALSLDWDTVQESEADSFAFKTY